MRLAKLRPLLLAAALCSASAFSPSLAAPFDSVEVSSEETLAIYQKVYIEPVAISLEEVRSETLTARRRSSRSSRQQPISEDTQERKAADLQADLVRHFSEHFTIVNEPSDDALTISAEITRLLSSRPTAEQRRRAVGSLIFASSVFAGGVDYNINLSSGDEQLYSIQERYRSSLSDNRPRVDVWQDANESFNRLSRQLVRFVRDN